MRRTGWVLVTAAVMGIAGLVVLGWWLRGSVPSPEPMHVQMQLALPVPQVPLRVLVLAGAVPLLLVGVLGGLWWSRQQKRHRRALAARAGLPRVLDIWEGEVHPEPVSGNEAQIRWLYHLARLWEREGKLHAARTAYLQVYQWARNDGRREHAPLAEQAWIRARKIDRRLHVRRRRWWVW